jgi:GNAT superfamily N-acetyltransferase
VPADIPALAEALLEQQSETRYPFRDPLPVPVEGFLHAHDAVNAWTAELEGRPVGHVCRLGPARGFPAARLLNEVCARAHGCDSDDLAWVSTLFVAAGARGLGIGRRLLDVVVDDAATAGLRPCLEVLPTHPGAMSLYLASGWRVVHRLRPDWLRAVVGEQGPDVHVMVLPATQERRTRPPTVDADSVSPGGLNYSERGTTQPALTGAPSQHGRM